MDRLGVRLLLLVLVLALAATGDVRIASACGAFAGKGDVPFLAAERVLLVWDETTGVEDFVRETRFDRASEPFGFVIPVPTRPEVAEVKVAPFSALARAYPFETIEEAMQRQMLTVYGGGPKGGPPAVEVLSEQRIGSFTAFTLAASEAGALDAWLASNGFVMSPHARPWIAPYVASRFFFVALRYDAKEKPQAQKKGEAPASLTSETVRIRFTTPNPYYPYMEPAHPRSNEHARSLEGWIVTRERMLPVAARANGRTGVRTWEVPWKGWDEYEPTSEALAATLGLSLSAIVPKAPALFVRTFKDDRSSRQGFGDVLFVPERPAKPDARRAEERRRLLTAIDPTLVDEAWAAAVMAPVAEPAPESAPAPSGSRSHCTVSDGGGPGGSALATALAGLAVVLGAARRARLVGRRRILALGVALVLTIVVLAGCGRRPREGAGGAPAASAAPTVAPAPLPPRAERETMALAMLAGELPDGVSEQSEGWTHFDEATLAAYPALEVEVAALAVQGTLTPWAKQIFEVFSEGALGACFRHARDPKIGGTIMLDVVVGPTGEVASSKEDKLEGIARGVAMCCAHALANLKLGSPYPDGGAKLGILVKFVPGGKHVLVEEANAKAVTEARELRGSVPGFSRVVAGLQPRFRRCLALAKEQGKVRGVVTIDVAIASTGEVTSSKASKVEGLSPEVVACCVAAPRGASFESPGAAGAALAVTVRLSRD